MTTEEAALAPTPKYPKKPKKLNKAWLGQMTDKEVRFLEAWAKENFAGAKMYPCAKEAGYEADGFRAIENASRAFQRLMRNEQMIGALQRQGVTMDFLAKKMKQLLESKHPFNPKQPDNMAQMKAWENAARVMDLNPPQKIDMEQHRETQLVISIEDIRRIEKIKDVEVIDVESIPTETVSE